MVGDCKGFHYHLWVSRGIGEHLVTEEENSTRAPAVCGETTPIESSEIHPSVAKAVDSIHLLAARMNPCPFKARNIEPVLEVLSEICQAFDGIIVIGGTGRETEFKVEAVGRAHGSRGGVKKDNLAVGSDGTVENGLSERAAEGEASRSRANPKALEFPGIGRDRLRNCAPGDESGG